MLVTLAKAKILSRIGKIDILNKSNLIHSLIIDFKFALKLCFVIELFL